MKVMIETANSHLMGNEDLDSCTFNMQENSPREDAVNTSQN